MLSNRALGQQGMTIVELLVGLTVGLIVVGMVLSVYLTTLGTSGDTLKSSRLNQEMAAIMNIMINDIRRAGYANIDGPDWDGGGVNDYENLLEPTTNPFNQIGSTALEVRDTVTDVDQGSQADGDCIVYGYDASGGDADDDGDVRDDNEFFGFKHNAADKSIMMRRAHDWVGGVAPNSCANGTWERLNDENSTEITTLIFDLSDSTCVNSAEPDGVGADDIDEADCYTTVPAVGSGVRTVERRDVQITLVGRLKEDTSVSARMVQRVSVRNDVVRKR